MNTSWWRTLNDLDEDQRNFILLPQDGKHLLVGPPGSGKTNLLLLRAQYLAGGGESNVLILTFTKTLTNFIRTGIAGKSKITPAQVKTYHSWASDHIRQYLNVPALAKGVEFDDDVRKELVTQVLAATQRAPSTRLYSAIFVDEAQDLTVDELGALLSLSDRVCICGDDKQGIYNKDGLNIAGQLGLQEHVLKRHFRIGPRVARVADRLVPAKSPEQLLESCSNYDVKKQGESSAKMVECQSRDEQFERMLESLQIQQIAFNDDSIGILCGKKETLSELRELFNKTELSNSVFVHGVDSDAVFGGARNIHVLTIHSAKGTEFRAVHIYGAEELANYPLNRTRIAYTAVTRAKTALTAYRTGPTSASLQNAFAQPVSFDLDALEALVNGGEE